MLVKTSELTDAALDWATTNALHPNMRPVPSTFRHQHYWGQYNFSTKWAQGGPLVERESIYLIPNENADGWFAHKVGGDQGDYDGPTPLIAAMRCYVARHLGEEVEIPEELV